MNFLLSLPHGGSGPPRKRGCMTVSLVSKFRSTLSFNSAQKNGENNQTHRLTKNGENRRTLSFNSAQKMAETHIKF